MKYYALKSRSLKFLNPPFPANDDYDAMNMVRNAAMAGADVALLNNIDDLDLCYVGEFDTKEGFTKTKVKVILSCGEIPVINEMVKEASNRVSHSDVEKTTDTD